MVRKIAKNGRTYHEPPYTQEEIDDFYRRVGNGPVGFTRPAAGAKPKLPTAQKAPAKQSAAIKGKPTDAEAAAEVKRILKEARDGD